VAGSFEHGNEPSFSVKDGEFLDYVSDHPFVKKDPASWSTWSTLQSASEVAPVVWAEVKKYYFSVSFGNALCVGAAAPQNAKRSCFRTVATRRN
jgi:hypothetical protein